MRAIEYLPNRISLLTERSARGRKQQQKQKDPSHWAGPCCKRLAARFTSRCVPSPS
jgi:hypothetical protein